jgi:TonB family protein
MINLLNSIAENWMAYFGYAILQNTLFLAVIFLVLHLLREKSAGIKYGIAAFGLLKLLVPPFVPITLRNVVSAAPTVGTFEIGEMSTRVVTNATSTALTISVLGILFIVWAATMLFMLGSSILSTLRLKWHLRDSAFVKHAEVDGRAVDIYCSTNISVPLSIGLFPKRVFVPTLWSSLTDELQHSLLRHEVAHIKRRDGFFGALQLIAQAIYFFHPLVWILTRQANEFREMACDDMAIDNSVVTPLVYSRCLVHVAEHMLPSWNCSSASTLIKQKNKLYHRVNYQVKETKMKQLSKHRSRLIWTLLLVLVVPLSWYCKQPDAAVGLKDNKTGKIYGTVTDIETGEPIAGANIILQNTPQGAASNEKGEYFIANVKPGKHSLQCSVMGYAETTINYLKVSKGKSLKQDFTMYPSSLQYGKVIISNKPSKKAKTADLAPPMSPAEPAELAELADPAEVDFIEYDEPPQPVGGFSMLLKDLRYPEKGKKFGIEGKVITDIFIDKNGSVTEYKIAQPFEASTEISEDGDPEKYGFVDFENAAAKALKNSKWIAATKDGESIGVWVKLPVKFKLKETQASKEFVPYDTPPEMINGDLAIQSNLIYPKEAKESGEQGTVIVQIKIGDDGTPEEAKVLKSFGSKLCDEAALKAVMLTKWTPAMQRDKNVSVWVTLPIEFKLDDETK